LIGLRSADIGDYVQPSEHLYSQIFNEAGLGTFVALKYRPRNSHEISLGNDQTSLFPFDYRSGGPFYGVNYFIQFIDEYLLNMSSSIGGYY
jgi:hypothetical protein